MRQYSSPKNFAFLFVFGKYLKMNGQTIFQPGNGFFNVNGQTVIKPFNAADVNGILAGLTNGNTGGTANTATAGTGPKPGTLQIVSLQDLINDATTTKINDTIAEEENPPPANNTDNPPPPPPPPPTDVTLRVLLAPGVYTAFPGTSAQFTTNGTGDSGILGGGTYPEGTQPPLSDDFNWTFQLGNGRLTGTVTGLTDANCFEDCGNPENIQTSTPPDAQVDFPSAFPVTQCADGVCGVLPSDHATVTQDGKTTTFVGLAVLRKDFYAYDLIGAPQQDSNAISTQANIDQGGPSSDPVLAFGGKGYDFGTPSGKTYAFALLPDVKELSKGVIAPFAGSGSFPAIPVDQNDNAIGPLPAISDLLYLEKDSANAEDPSRAVWLQQVSTSTPRRPTPKVRLPSISSLS